MDYLTIKERFFLAYRLKDELLKATPWGDQRNEIKDKVEVRRFHETAILDMITLKVGWIEINSDGTLKKCFYSETEEKMPQLDKAVSSYEKSLDGLLHFLESKRSSSAPAQKPMRNVNIQKYFNKVYTDVNDTFKELKRDAGEFETGTPKQKSYAEKIRDNILTGFALNLIKLHNINSSASREAKNFINSHQRDFINALGIRDAAAFLGIYAGSNFADNPYGDRRVYLRPRFKKYYY